MTTKKLSRLAIFIALSFVLSTVIVFPNMAPAQHMMNVVGSMVLGPVYNAIAAFVSGLFRMALSGRAFIATSGWVGALLSGLAYKHTKNIFWTGLSEVVGSGILSAFVYYFPMKFIYGLDLPNPGYYIPFFLPSALVGAIIGMVLLAGLRKIDSFD